MDVNGTGMGRTECAASGRRGGIWTQAPSRRRRSPRRGSAAVERSAPQRRTRRGPASAKTAGENLRAPSEPGPATGLSPALIAALATQLTAMLVADLTDHVLHGASESRPTASGRPDETSKTAGSATEDPVEKS